MVNIKAEDLVLHVTEHIDPKKCDLDKYDDFLDELCGHRDYQKEATLAIARFLLGGAYKNTEELAKENFEQNQKLKDYYLTFEKLKNKLEFPDKLACTIDLATAAGKSWVMYGIAQIMLCEGVVDQILILCPSRTVKTELIEKFENYAIDKNLRATLQDASIPIKINPHITDASRTIKIGDICIDNIHKTYSRTESSIETSLRGKGGRTLVLNDESHHIMNPKAESSLSETKLMNEWKKFLSDKKYNFNYIVGFSGTPYIENEYARDVVYRYSIMQAMSGEKAANFVIKKIDYVQKDESINEEERLNIIYSNHQNNKKLWKRAEKHITIFITQTIAAAEKLHNQIIDFIAKKEKIQLNEAQKKALVVTSSPKHEKNREILKYVDKFDNPVEWIVSVSMLTEGWDVDNVFQIVPHEKRAFNSKLLIAQVLGRGLRVPKEYETEQPTVIVYNHDKWSAAIKDLVYEVMSYENRIKSYVVKKEKDYNFDLFNLNYKKEEINIKKHPVKKPFKLPKIPSLSSQSEIIKRRTVYYQVKTSAEKEVFTEVSINMYNIDRVVEDIYNKLAIFDEESNTNYSKELNRVELRKRILSELDKIKDKTGRISEENKNRIERAFDVLKREVTGTTTIKRIAEKPFILNTKEIREDSIRSSDLQANNALIYEENSLKLSRQEDILLIKKAIEDAIHRNVIEVSNKFLFKCPLNVVILAYSNEIEFGKYLVSLETSKLIDAWLKNVDRGFYSVPYSYRKGTHQKWANFNPDFFIKLGKNVLVVEIKSDEDITEVNRAKLKYAKQHFDELNKKQKKHLYHFKFLSKRDFPQFFEVLKKGTYASYVSNLEAELTG